MNEPGKIEAFLRAEFEAFSSAPFSFAGAVLALVFFGVVGNLVVLSQTDSGQSVQTRA